MVWFYFRVKTKKYPYLQRNTDDPGNVVSRSESSHLPLIAEKIKSNHLTEFMNDNDNKYYNKAVDNIQKYDISKGTKDVVLKPDPKKVVENEIQTWLQEYKSAWEKGDIETLKELGHISSEKEENKLRQHYTYVRDMKVSIQNEAIEVNNDNKQTTISFDRTDEWTDERGERHKESLPRIVKTLRKENNIWKIAK